ncbi:MAG: M48 family metallopeptidase [Xanthomonadales bacterium]|nr:M48 family metallopeptidase [Xanthomonadales bacterium]
MTVWPRIILAGRWCVGGLVAAGLTLAAANSIADDLPDLGDSSARMLSVEKEREYSEGLLRQLRNYDLSITDPELVEYLETLAYRLVQSSGRSEIHFHFELIDVPVVNAFASPGGLVVTFSQLMLHAETESELAGVLAHEIAHVTQRHITRRMESSMEDLLPILLGTVALAIATQGQGDGAQAALAGGMALLQQRQINFTRANEHEADRVGIQTLAKAGFDPIGMGDFFARIGALHRTQGEKPPEYLQTHPVTATRVAEAKARADKLRAGTQLTSLEFMLMRERLRVLSTDDLPALVRFYQDAKRASEIDPRALAYGLALAQSRLGEAAEAHAALEKLAAKDPQRLSYQLALAESERGARDFDAANARYQRLLEARPGHRVISIAYARSQIERDGQEAGRRAAEVLRPLMSLHGDDPALQELYARANELAGQPVRAAEAYAQSYFLRGKFEDALRQLEQTAARDDLDYYDRARIDAQVAEWQPIVLRERRRAEERERG